MRLKWLQTPSCRSMRTASRKAAARSVRAATAAAGSFMVPIEADYSASMKHALFILALLALVACTRINQENFSKVQNGMTEQEVVSILGNPSESSSREVLGISGTTSVWRSGDSEITVRFVGGKVALKS